MQHAESDCLSSGAPAMAKPMPVWMPVFMKSCQVGAGAAACFSIGISPYGISPPPPPPAVPSTAWALCWMVPVIC